MKLKFFNPQHLEKNLKATVHKTGKLGFTIEAAKKMELDNTKSIGIAFNEEDENDNNLYIIVYQDKNQGGFPIYKAGQYYYLNTKPLFDSLKIDYVKNTIMFDITAEDIEGQQVYKFARREKMKKGA